MSTIALHVQASVRERVERLQEEMRKLPQWEPETFHYFADGMYLRLVPRPAGALIVGRVHRREHFYLVLQGTVLITGGDSEPTEITGPKVIVSQPGTKRAVYAKTDAVCATVHRTDKRDLEDIEEELVEPDPDCMDLPGNILKQKVLP